MYLSSAVLLLLFDVSLCYRIPSRSIPIPGYLLNAVNSYQSLLKLGFMVTATEDARITTEQQLLEIGNQHQPISFQIKEANFNCLPSIVSLRVNVFYPEVNQFLILLSYRN